MGNSHEGLGGLLENGPDSHHHHRFGFEHDMKNLPLGTAYTIWTGIGIVGTSILSVFLFNEAISPAQVICIILIATGIVGLRLLAE